MQNLTTCWKLYDQKPGLTFQMDTKLDQFAYFISEIKV